MLHEGKDCYDCAQDTAPTPIKEMDVEPANSKRRNKSRHAMLHNTDPCKYEQLVEQSQSVRTCARATSGLLGFSPAQDSSISEMGCASAHRDTLDVC